MSGLTEELLKKPPYNENTADDIYVQALKEELLFHYRNNPAYRRFCDQKHFDPFAFSGDIEEIPPVYVSVFKELGRELCSVPDSDIKLTLQSSATSGVPSSIPVDSITAKRQRKAMIKVVGEYIGNERKPFMIMDVDPMSGFREILGARYAAVSGYLNFASSATYFLKVNEKKRYYYDTDEIKGYVDGLDTNQPVIVFGFTYILYSEIVLPLQRQGCSFRLPEGSRVIHIGGWKKLESEKVDKEIFNSVAADTFGISKDNVIDIYGFTEQMGLNYPDCRCGWKHTSVYSDVIVRDIATKEVLPAGREGLLEFVSPLPHSYPGNAVITDDIGMVEEGLCACGLKGKRFKVLGRLKRAEIRGCGDILSDKLKFTHNDSAESIKQGSFSFFYPAFSGQAADEPEQYISLLEKDLRAALVWLRRQPIDVLIGLISQVIRKWCNQAEEKENKPQGVSFLREWCSAENLLRTATEGLRGNRLYVDSFIPASDTDKRRIRATSRGLVCHWLAGNVQILGMFVLIQSLITKNVNLIRLSSRDGGVFQDMLTAFQGERFETKGGYVIYGDDLLKAVALVSFDHAERKLNEKMSRIADVRVAWGGSESITAVSGYPSRYDCADILMGPKLSFSVIGKESLQDERKSRKLARRVAVDASVFDQTGCASTHNVFVERGGSIDPEAFSRILADAMAKVSTQIKKGEMSPEESAAVHSIRGIYDFKGIVFGDTDSAWTVLYDDKVDLHAPVYSRVVFVHSVDDINEVLPFIDDNIQTIGLAVTGERAGEFASAAAERGAVRFPVCGRMLNFESPWDGMFIIDRLVKWNTLGGPLV